MKYQQPRKTESSFSNNAEVKKLAGFTNANREGIKNISTSLYDVDFAIKWHIENMVKPTILEDNAVLTVPVLFASGEKWAAIQRHGYLRDNQGKILTPLIIIRRNSLSRREDIQDLRVSEAPEARMIFEKKYTSANRYDRFSLSNRPVKKEYYSVDVPKFVQVEYDLLCWTNNTAQINELVEQILWFDGKAFGDTYKFITHIEPPSFETINNTGEDRMVRANLQMRVKAHILNTHGPAAPSIYRLVPVNKLVLGVEIDGIGSDLSTNMYSPNVSTSGGPSSSGPSRSTSYSSTLVYLNSNTYSSGTVVNSTTVTFPNGWLKAPYPLPATNLSNFMFYVNGALIEPQAIVSFTESSGTSTLVINETSLGFSLEVTDEVIGIGKFM